ncbi:exosortase H-associated membrane protein [Candidatus Venteria ishoeyi]|uniref:exosortase H-associated membrane protein n=1 Tax=Candidatus Venteria ishoeyi TaxID=1899563 RepID=UPI0025A53A41|nr:exosortase H-associated membrane protein [Candidatus Venteria ishoeyi]MDM8546731.1 exosortase H-associated membrane protein [Candidatus Venteria ishoeyi]
MPKPQKIAAQPRIDAFVLRILLLLPFCFGLWFLLSLPLLAPVAWLSDGLLKLFYPDLIAEVVQQVYTLDVITRIDSQHIDVSNQGLLVLTVNPLLYGYGIPLLVALMLAGLNPGPLGNLFWVWLCLLLPIQVFGVVMAILHTLVFEMPVSVAMQVTDSETGRNILALINQFSSLILPGLTPFIIWFYLQQDYLLELIPQLKRLYS